MTYNIPLLDFKRQQVGYREGADWQIDFTTKDDTAAYAAAAALDPATPCFLRIASFQPSARELVGIAEATGQGRLTLVRLSSRGDLAAQIQRARAANPAGEQQFYADWQQVQHLLSMFSMQNQTLDHAHCPDLTWTSAATFLTA